MTDLHNDYAVEAVIQEKGLTAPRVTPQQIDALMADVWYHSYVVPGTTTTVAVAFDKNNFSLAIGTSACASPENFSAEVGHRIAQENAEKAAREELWKLEGYKLKRELMG